MATVKLIIRPSYKKKNNTVPIAIRITKNRKSRFIFTGEYILEKNWNSSAGLAKNSHPNSKRLNNFLLKKLLEAREVALEIGTQDSHETASQIKKRIVIDRNADFFSVAESHLASVKKRKKFSQYNTDKGRIEMFKAYLGRSTLPFRELTVGMLNKFQAYLLHDRGNAQRTAMNYMILFRTVYNLAISEAIVDRKTYPFGKGKVQIKFPESEKIGLSKEDVLLLENVDGLTDAQQHALNVWLLSFYFAGVRVGDVLQLKWKDFKNDRLYYRMGKNEKLVSLKVPTKAQTILEKYRLHESDNGGFVFKELNGTKPNDKDQLTVRIKTVTRNFNKHLKRIAERLEIDKNISMHIARHTFGNISGSTIPIQVLQKLYRHSSITTTINYQKNFIHEETDEALDKVINF